MINRLMVALGAALVFVGPVFAQRPAFAQGSAFVQKPTPQVPIFAQETPAREIIFVQAPTAVQPMPVPEPIPAPAGALAPAPVPIVIEETVPGYAPWYVERPGLPGGTGQFWATADYLFAWVRGADFGPLITTSPPGTLRPVAGVMGAPSTQVLFGGRMNDDLRSGYRFETGYWFDLERTWGVEAGFTIIESQATTFAATSGGIPILARPFIDAVTGTSEAVLIAFPGVASGAVEARAFSGNFYEVHFDLTENIFDAGWVRLNTLVGYRYYRYDEGLRIRQLLAPLDPGFVPGTQIVALDRFNTQNEFHGCDLGLRGEFFWNDLSLGLLAKATVGSLNREVNIRGGQVVTVPGVEPVFQTGGVLALDSNIGRHTSRDWTVVPEFGITLGWQVNPNLRLRLGYSALFLTQLARAANQIDLTIDPALFPPATVTPTPADRPVFDLIRTDAWIQSINLGMEFTY